MADRAPFPGKDAHPLAGARIVHVVRQYRPGIGGIEAVVEALARAQRSVGIDARVVTLNRIFDSDLGPLPANEIIEGVPVSRVAFSGSKRYPIAPGVLRHIRGARLVHVHGVDFLSDFLAFTRPLHRRTLVLSTHGGFFHTAFAARAKRIWFATITRAAIRAFSFVAASSFQDEATFRRLRRSGVSAIENGVDLAKFAGASAKMPERCIIYFGRLAPNKGLAELIHWFARLPREWRLIIAGKPMGVTIEELRNLADVSGVGSAVELHDTPTDAELEALIGRASVYACASHYEGFGLAAVEAMSAGLFPVLSAIPAFERTIARAGIGLTLAFTAADAPMRFEAVWTAWAHDPERGSALRASVEPFGWAHAARAFEDAYGRVLGIRTRRILGTDVAATTTPEAIARIDRAITTRERLTVAFCNAHTLNLAAADAKYAATLARCWLLNDGIGVDLGSRALFGARFPENLNGTDFTPAFLTSTIHPLRIFLLGAKPAVISRAAERIAQQWPRHTVVGFHSGYFAGSEAPAIAQQIAALAPDVILVGMGNPRQEQWAVHDAGAFVGVALCIGAWFDFLVGAVPRAPMWMQRARIEWLFRLVQEPERMWRRYLIGNVTFLGRVARQWWRGDRA